MYKTTSLRGYRDGGRAHFGYVETDPSGRYGRFTEILGKGAMKTVYKAFDEVLGLEVAWNQVKLNDVFRSPVEVERLYSEVHLLKNLDHESIIRFYTSWIDVDQRTFNFITEMFTSGSLREYRQKYPQVDIRAVKNWARQILRGLAYLHGHDPPVIHRDLKCDNIFVNGHLGQVKIGDLGLAAILRGSRHAHSIIGTPEFMAQEMYEENYNELVDIYSFGMCVLEMLTAEYPYSECSNPAQIYKKVTSGKLPEAFHRIQDVEAQCFIGKCLETVSKRLPAKELLLDPFLVSDEGMSLTNLRAPTQKSASSGTLMSLVPAPTRTTDMTITGTMNAEDDIIFLKVQISHKDGNTRNIYFPFHIVNDTATDVAVEMVKELEITDWEPLEIAEMIEEEISSMVHRRKRWGSAQVHHQHSFSYEDEDDDNRTRHPFYYNSSSHASSQASLPAFVSSHEPLFHDGNGAASDHSWLHEEDASSSSSWSSPKYSNVNYYLDNGDDYRSILREGEPASNLMMHKSTRFCPAASTSHYQCNEQLDSWRGRGVSQHRKLTRIQSLVDVRRQLLHRSLMEAINKRRLFKTVGAVENIGYHEPAGFSDKFF